MKRLFTLILCLLLLCAAVPTAYATEVDTQPPTEAGEDGEIIYTDGIDKFIFITDSEYHDTDQFHNFKTVMPGDVIDQRILLRNDITNNCKIKVYMRSHGAHASSEDFLEQLKMKIVKDTDTVMFDASAAEAGQLTDWVYLGTLYSGGECELIVTLEVPVTLGNEYANQVGYLDWEFGVSEFPVEDTDPVPPTGDTSALTFWIGICAASAGALIILLICFRRKKKE